MKWTNTEIGYIKAFEDITGITVKDCLSSEGNITFLVKQNQLGLAIGKNGSTVKKAREKLGKNIEVFEFSKDPEMFLRRAFYKVKVDEVVKGEKEGKKFVQVNLDSENKRKLLQNLNRLKRVREVMERSYGIKNVNIR